MHRSFFSYNVTRPYPFRWFTPTVVVGAIIAAALISFINFASAGYELVATSSNNPNATIDNSSQYGGVRWPAYFIQKTQATCAPATLPLGTLVYTTNNALAYTLNSVWRFKDNGRRENLGSLVYLNNNLQNCSMSQVRIELSGRYKQSQLILATTHIGILVSALVTCTVDIDTSHAESAAQGPTYFELDAKYELIHPKTRTFLSRNATKSPSLYWGESLLSAYLLLTAKAYVDGAKDKDWYNDDVYDAAIILTRQAQTGNGTREETMTNNFFHVECYTEHGYCKPHDMPSLLRGGSARWFEYPYPNIWNRVDILGKAMWFTVLTDLGFNKSTVPNMFVYPDLLANLTANLTNEAHWWKTAREDANKKKYDFKVNMQMDSGLALASFDRNQTPQAPLGAAPAFLSTNYICQVPQTKSPGILFISIFVADLVLLQAVWLVFRLIVDTVSQRRYPSMGYCSGCTENIELVGVGVTDSSSTAALIPPSRPVSPLQLG
ncbi:hypothetical protein PG999_010617 [Apiospora kogelbergensis]|uniref:Uncharacterized protein n=1 Tax=Apiospora kogelbergensis TaxID=1337665 RepID=A0AAW0QRY0_9PEZI